MKNLHLSTSACRYCQYYNPQGRRGGICKLLEVPVKGDWKACSLSLPPFAPSWESIQDLMKLQEKLTVDYSLNYSAPNPSQAPVTPTPERVAAKAMSI